MPVLDNGARDQYTATAAQTVFPYTFEIFAKEDVAVEVDGVLKAEGTDYTVSGVGNDSGGNITFLAGRTAGEIITIYRDMELKREQDYQQSGDFLSDEVDADFDRIWLALQQLKSSYDLAIRADINDSALNSTNTKLADVATRAGKSLGFAADGTIDYLSSAMPIGNFAFFANFASADNATELEPGDYFFLESRGNSIWKVIAKTGSEDGYSVKEGTTYSYQLQADGFVNVEWFGAVGDGVTDDTLALQAAIDYADSNFSGGTVYFMPKTYIITDTILLKENTSYIGLGSVSVNFPETTPRGTTFEWSGGVTTVIDDDASVDNTGDWLTVDANLTFSTDHYVVTYTANTQYIYQTVPALTVGKYYRFSFTIKDGTEANVPVTAYINTALGGGGAVLAETVNTTDRWEEHSYIIQADTAGLDTIQLFSTLASGSYEVRDIFLVEVDRMFYAENLQHERFENFTLIGNYTSSNRSNIVGLDIESIDAITQNSRRGIYKNFMIKDCYMGIAMSSLVKDSGNTDGYVFEKFDILDCYTCIETYSRFVAYCEFKSGSISYYKYGINFDRATGAEVKGVAGYTIPLNPVTQSAMFRITDASGVVTFINNQSEYIAGQTEAQCLFAVFEGDADNFNCTNFLGNYVQQRIDIYERQHNLFFAGNAISFPVTCRAGSDETVIQSVSNREYNGGGFAIDAGVTAVVSRAPEWLDPVTVTWDPPSIAAGGTASQAFTVSGVSTNDFVLVSYSGSTGGLQMTAEASASNQVTIYLNNNTAGAIDLPSSDFFIRVMRNR